MTEATRSISFRADAAGRLGDALPLILVNLRELRRLRDEAPLPGPRIEIIRLRHSVSRARNFRPFVECGSVAVRWDGIVSPCLHLHECGQRLQAFDSSPCASCNTCESADDNRQDCSGSPLPACGGCLWAQGLIQCP